MTEQITIVFPIYTGVTHLDFTGPHQFVSRLAGAKVIVASVGGALVTADGLTFADLADLGAIGQCDVLCVPGGVGCVAAMRDAVYMDAIRWLAATARYVTSVCTGSLILGAAGLLKGRRAACHWAWRDMLPAFGAIPDPGRVVRDGSILTGGGVTAGIDFSLALIGELAGAEVAQSIQLGLEYAPEPPFHAGRPEIAPPAILEAVTARMAPAMADRRDAVQRAAEALRAGARPAGA
ncbi:DJ-1/PfpI family protein [Acidiphilium sp. AL]|uniref:DJ-1/PfpI family protein n=1 Tax=Acidiphilium iwatense TaxID=768198 RepID=A0ABS9DXX4_9PROT|nr:MULTISPECIES: DJ-1/PfpI family protein [Acidiphilium]MCF3947597.1 DJ-1/PfpI family protein [Acidiphilium iwatense]MCU4160763.1 DJ-1/PfpI family protein [Acidiphilium sp. AL]